MLRQFFFEGRPPSDAIAILTALLASRPSQELLSFGAWEVLGRCDVGEFCHDLTATVRGIIQERWP